MVICGQADKKRSKVDKYINLDMFRNITKPEIAYILGLIWADGYVGQNTVTISALESDLKEVSNLFMKSGEWTVERKTNNRYGIIGKPSITIRMCCRELMEILQESDYISKSKLSADKILSKIPDNLKHYWFRGLIDGDGYIWYSKTGMYRLTITSAKEQDWKYMEDLCKNLGIKYSIIRDSWKNKENKTFSRSVFIISNCYGVKTLCEFIFNNKENDNIGFSRKYNKWMEILNYIKMNPPKSGNSIKRLK